MRLERLLSIVFLLLNREKMSAPDLAERFDVSMRTIYRDIKTIDRAGIPIVSYPGQNGGYSILDTYRIDKQVLSFQEMASIVNALRGVNKALGDEELELTIEKIGSLMPRPKHKSDNYRSPIAIDLLPWGGIGKKSTKLQDIYQTISARKLIRITYAKPNGEVQNRTIEPMTILFKSYGWYLFAFCRLRNDYRIFKLSRIKNIDLLNRNFTMKAKDYHEVIDWSESKQKNIRVTLKFSSEIKNIVEDHYPEEQLKYIDDRAIIVETEFPEGEWIYSYILSFGSLVEVLEPKHIRNKILNSAKKIQKIYQP